MIDLNARPGEGPRPAERAGTGVRLRPLTVSDGEPFRDHLLRLDERSRRLRFGSPVNDAFILAYAARTAPARRIGLFDGQMLRGVAELHRAARDPLLAEGAFSLEEAYRGHGHGTRLFDALLFEAEGAGIARLELQCLRENVAMQRIARRFSARLSFDGSETMATIVLPPAALSTVGDWPASLSPVSPEPA